MQIKFTSMDKKMNQLKVPFIVATVAIGIALLPMPYGYYMILRLVLTTVFGYATYLLFQQENKFWIVLAGTAVLYNPLIPIHIR